MRLIQVNLIAAIPDLAADRGGGSSRPSMGRPGGTLSMAYHAGLVKRKLKPAEWTFRDSSHSLSAGSSSLPCETCVSSSLERDN
jgi:hypothetical protein